MLHLPELGDHPVSLHDARVARRVYTSLDRWLIRADRTGRERLLGALATQLRPRPCPVRHTLTWEEVGRLRERYPLFELGAHTRDHLDLTACSPAAAAREIASSIDDARAATGVAPRHFSFPFGRTCPAARAAVEVAGLRSAAVMTDGVLGPATDRFAIPRLEAPREPWLFELLTGPAHGALAATPLGRA